MSTIDERLERVLVDELRAQGFRRSSVHDLAAALRKRLQKEGLAPTLSPPAREHPLDVDTLGKGPS